MAEANPQLITLLNVRASFLHVFEAQEQKNDDGSSRWTFNGAFMLPKQGIVETAANLEKIKAAGNAARVQKWGSDPSKWPMIPSYKMCLRDGDNPEHYDPNKRPEYAGHFILSASCQQKDPPSVITNRLDSDKRWIPAVPGQAGAPYSGCFANVIVQIWAQDNKHGTRINADLKTVQYRSEGEAFGNAPVDPNAHLTADMVSQEGQLPDAGGDGGGLL